jgi:hypothetical protein
MDIFHPLQCLAPLAAIALAAAGRAHAALPELVFSADDQTSEFMRDTMRVRPDARTGAVTAIDFSSIPPRIWHEENVPCSVIGPPTCIASTRDGAVILVAGAMKADPADPTKLIQDRRVTRLRWTDRGLERIAQIEVGGQPSGVALTNHGQRAYVTLRAEGRVAILDLRGDRGLRVVGRVALARAADSLSHLAIAMDESSGLATLHDRGAVLAFEITPQELRLTQELRVGLGPYDVKLFSDGRRAVVGDTLDDAAYLLTRDQGRWRVGQRIPLGHANEGIALSPDEKWIAASCFNGAQSPGPTDRWFGQPSRIYLLAENADGYWRQQQSVEVDSMPQSAVFTPDGRRLVAGEYGRGDLRVFSFGMGAWADTGMRIALPGQPAALDTAGR